MILAQIIFWSSLAIILYTYLGYGGILLAINSLKRKVQSPDIKWDDLPPVTMLIAAYNEEDFIREKLDNTLQLKYPKDKLQIYVVTDGSTDSTPEIVQEYPGVQLYHEDSRRGKIHAVNRVMPKVNTPYVVFCDANTMLNPKAVQNIVRHYQDPQVGGVSGEKRIVSHDADNSAGAGEGLYWKYESFLKRMDSDLYSMVGTAGELFSLRTELYEAPAEDMVIEDFYMSMRIVARGYRFVYEPKAMATETASASVEDEWKRKVRITAGGFQAMSRLSYLMNPMKYGTIAFQYISHRVLRWTLAPVALVTILLSNLALASTGSLLFQGILAAQVAFYLLAGAGYLLRAKEITIKGFFVPFYFTVMNVSVFAGFFRHMGGRQSVVWEKTQRAAA